MKLWYFSANDKTTRCIPNWDPEKTPRPTILVNDAAVSPDGSVDNWQQHCANAYDPKDDNRVLTARKRGYNVKWTTSFRGWIIFAWKEDENE